MPPGHSLLCALRGFRNCDLLIASAERTAWQVLFDTVFDEQISNFLESCRTVSERAGKTLEWVTGFGLLSEALDHLTPGRATLYTAIFEKSCLDSCTKRLEQALQTLRRAGQLQYLPLDLLTRAWLFGLTEQSREQAFPWKSVAQDLNEARRLIEKHGYGRRIPEFEDAEAVLERLRLG